MSALAARHVGELAFVENAVVIASYTIEFWVGQPGCNQGADLMVDVLYAVTARA